MEKHPLPYQLRKHNLNSNIEIHKLFSNKFSILSLYSFKF